MEFGEAGRDVDGSTIMDKYRWAGVTDAAGDVDNRRVVDRLPSKLEGSPKIEGAIERV